MLGFGEHLGSGFFSKIIILCLLMHSLLNFLEDADKNKSTLLRHFRFNENSCMSVTGLMKASARSDTILLYLKYDFKIKILLNFIDEFTNSINNS